MAASARTGARARLHPLRSPVGRGCARPGCRTPAAATLGFSYADRTARIDDLALEPSPADYDLCAEHAGRTRPPHGWVLRDERAGPRPAGSPSRRDVVAVLADALPSSPAAAPHAGPVGRGTGEDDAASPVLGRDDGRAGPARRW